MSFGALNVSTSRMGGPTRGTARMALPDPLLSSRSVKLGCNLVAVLARLPRVKSMLTAVSLCAPYSPPCPLSTVA